LTIMQRQTLIQKVSPANRSLLVMKTELVKLFNTMIRLEESLGKIEGCDETKTLVLARFEDAYKTLKSFIDQYEKKQTLVL
jgi:hypothetical protein